MWYQRLEKKRAASSRSLREPFYHFRLAHDKKLFDVQSDEKKINEEVHRNGAGESPEVHNRARNWLQMCFCFLRVSCDENAFEGLIRRQEEKNKNLTLMRRVFNFYIGRRKSEQPARAHREEPVWRILVLHWCLIRLGGLSRMQQMRFLMKNAEKIEKYRKSFRKP